MSGSPTASTTYGGLSGRKSTRIASPADRIALSAVSRCPLTATASAPAAQTSLTTVCRSRSVTRPSSVCVGARVDVRAVVVVGGVLEPHDHARDPVTGAGAGDRLQARQPVAASSAPVAGQAQRVSAGRAGPPRAAGRAAAEPVVRRRRGARSRPTRASRASCADPARSRVCAKAVASSSPTSEQPAGEDQHRGPAARRTGCAAARGPGVALVERVLDQVAQQQHRVVPAGRPGGSVVRGRRQASRPWWQSRLPRGSAARLSRRRCATRPAAQRSSSAAAAASSAASAQTWVTGSAGSGSTSAQLPSSSSDAHAVGGVERQRSPAASTTARMTMPLAAHGVGTARRLDVAARDARVDLGQLQLGAGHQPDQLHERGDAVVRRGELRDHEAAAAVTAEDDVRARRRPR